MRITVGQMPGIALNQFLPGGQGVILSFVTRNRIMQPDITAFFDEATFTTSYVVAEPGGTHCAIIDSVLDFDPKSARTRTESADRILRHVEERSLSVDWILETHAHADHLTAAPRTAEARYPFIRRVRRSPRSPCRTRAAVRTCPPPNGRAGRLRGRILHGTGRMRRR